MATGFLGRNWQLLTTIVGVALVRELLQRRKTIDLQGQVVLITGGSRGLGLALADEFSRQGAKLVLCSRDDVELAHAHTWLTVHGTEVLLVHCDVTDVEQVQQLVAQATARFGHIDILVNNAGIISMGPLETLTRADFEESMNITFWGSYNTIMAVLPQMRKHKSGRIVNIASIGGKVSVPHLLSYTSAKFALIGFSEGLHTELAKDGITVVTVAPGLMRTGSHVNATMKGNKHTQEYALFNLADTLPGLSIAAQRAARQIVNATRRGETELIISAPAQLIARLHGVFPGFITDILTLTDKFLPGGKGAGTASYLGKQNETPLSQSFLTRLGQKAAKNYNEQSEEEI